MNSYKKGKRWAWRIFRKNLNVYGEVGVRKSDKASVTCSKYANNKKINKTSQGKVLNKDLRSFYKGAADGFLEAYNSFSKK